MERLGGNHRDKSFRLGTLSIRFVQNIIEQQIGCYAPNHHIRDKRESEGDSPCTGEGDIGVYVFKELELCPNGCGNIPFVLCTFSEFTLTE